MKEALDPSQRPITITFELIKDKLSTKIANKIKAMGKTNTVGTNG
jgi:hypothetical protein